MDPFTQKLLQRTQARKEQLAKKREELAAFRGTKNATDRDNQRRPLSEDNKDSKESTAEVSKRIKIDSENCTKDTPREKVKNAPEIDASSPSIKARKERLIQMQQKAKENVPTPKKHWKPLDLGEGKERSSSPSIAARSAAFETKAADQDKVQGQEPALPITPRKLSETRDIFEKGTQSPQADNTEKKKSTAPPKPPRLAEEKPKRAQEKKRKAPSPPVSEASDSDASSDKSAEQQATKRKAPSPPPKVNDSGSSDNTRKGGSSKETKSGAQVDSPKRDLCEKDQAKQPRLGEMSDRDSSDSEKSKRPKPQKSKNEGLGNTTVVICKAAPADCSDQPTPKPRKRLQVAENSSEAVDANRKPEDKGGSVGPARKSKKSNVIFATAQVVDGGVKKKTPKKEGRETVVVQACVVESSGSHDNRQSTTTVQAIPCEDQPRAAPARTKVTRVSPNENQASRVEKVSNVTAVTEKTTSKDKTATNQVPEKRSERPQHKAPEKNLEECMTDLNETVNLNDVNIHEITFNFDFSKFDEELKENKEGFKMSYEERCKKLEQEGQTTHAPSHDVDELSPPSGVVTVQEMGIHTSGYNSIASEQYAAKAKSPSSCQPPTVKRQTHDEKIKTMLEKAAFQQNIVLQASRAVNLCAATNDVHLGKEGEVEAERVLLLATERRQSCLNEVQRLKTNPSDAMPEFLTKRDEAAMPCQATVYLEGIQLPLKQEFMDSFSNGIRSDLGIYYFVCIVEQGPDLVFCSRVQSTTDVTEGTFLKFPDKFDLENVKPNFVVTLKLFAMNVKRIPVNVTPTPKHKIFQSPKVIKNKLRVSARRGVDAATSVPMTASPKTVFRTSSFSLVGVTHVTLPLVNSKKFTLDQVPEGCPVNNYLQVNIQCIPTYTSRVKGFLTILEDVGGYGAWQRRWCTLEGGLLQYWRYPGDETTKAPLGCLDLGQCVSNTITTVSRDLCARPNTMELKVTRNKGESSTEVKYLLAADTKPDRSTWLNSLNDALKDFRAWNPKPLYPKLGHMFNQDVYMCLPSEKQKESDL